MTQIVNLLEVMTQILSLLDTAETTLLYGAPLASRGIICSYIQE